MTTTICGVCKRSGCGGHIEMSTTELKKWLKKCERNDAIRNLKKSIKYCSKSFLSVISGFKKLEIKIDGEWVDVLKINYTCNLYYVCVKFENGRHIPLPILVYAQYGNIGVLLQKIAIALAGIINPISLIRAVNSANRYLK